MDAEEVARQKLGRQQVAAFARHTSDICCALLHAQTRIVQQFARAYVSGSLVAALHARRHSRVALVQAHMRAARSALVASALGTQWACVRLSVIQAAARTRLGAILVLKLRQLRAAEYGQWRRQRDHSDASQRQDLQALELIRREDLRVAEGGYWADLQLQSARALHGPAAVEIQRVVRGRQARARTRRLQRCQLDDEEEQIEERLQHLQVLALLRKEVSSRAYLERREGDVRGDLRRSHEQQLGTARSALLPSGPHGSPSAAGTRSSPHHSPSALSLHLRPYPCPHPDHPICILNDRPSCTPLPIPNPILNPMPVPTCGTG